MLKAPLLLVSASALLALCSAQPYDMTVEYLKAPLGVDVAKPRFSWKNSAPRRGLVQQSYQLQVSTSADFLALLWDSKTVSTAQSSFVAYDGPALASSTKYYWRVQTVVDKASGASNWSSSSFGTGLLSNADWGAAKWITGGDSMNLLRKEFKVTLVDPDAMLFISGIGYHEVKHSI